MSADHAANVDPEQRPRKLRKIQWNNEGRSAEEDIKMALDAIMDNQQVIFRMMNAHHFTNKEFQRGQAAATLSFHYQQWMERHLAFLKRRVFSDYNERTTCYLKAEFAEMDEYDEVVSDKTLWGYDVADPVGVWPVSQHMCRHPPWLRMHTLTHTHIHTQTIRVRK